MGTTEQNRRRNQIIAERSAEKVRRERGWSAWSDAQLWEAVNACIRSSLHTQRYMGHVDKTVEAAVAEGAAGELRMRGTQLALPGV
jgi:hypothetical protein